MPETSINFSGLSMTQAIDEMGEDLLRYLWIKGREAYKRHVSVRAERTDDPYSLEQMAAIGCTSPLAEGFTTKIVRQARLALCSHILGLKEPMKSFKDLDDFELYVLFGMTRVEMYYGYYSADMWDVYQQCVHLQE